MKKIILFFVPFFACFAANSQIEFGLRGGMNLANFQTDYPDKAIIAAGNIYYYGGAYVNYRLPHSFSIGLGAEYSVEGGNVNDVNNAYLATGQYTIQYLAVPLLLKYRISPVFFVEAGPDLDVLLTAKVSQNNNPVPGGTSGFNTINIGWKLGFGFLIIKHLGIDFHYLYGISNVVNNQNDVQLNNRVIQMGFFYDLKN